MPERKKKGRVAPGLVEADVAVRVAVRPWRRSAPVKALSLYSELGDQPQMLAITGGLLAVGLVLGDRRMARPSLG